MWHRGQGGSGHTDERGLKNFLHGVDHRGRGTDHGLGGIKKKNLAKKREKKTAVEDGGKKTSSSKDPNQKLIGEKETFWDTPGRKIRHPKNPQRKRGLKGAKDSPLELSRKKKNKGGGGSQNLENDS